MSVWYGSRLFYKHNRPASRFQQKKSSYCDVFKSTEAPELDSDVETGPCLEILKTGFPTSGRKFSCSSWEQFDLRAIRLLTGSHLHLHSVNRDRKRTISEVVTNRKPTDRTKQGHARFLHLITKCHFLFLRVYCTHVLSRLRTADSLMPCESSSLTLDQPNVGEQ